MTGILRGKRTRSDLLWRPAFQATSGIWPAKGIPPKSSHVSLLGSHDVLTDFKTILL